MMPLQSDSRKRTYPPPKLNKLTPERAKLILVGHASRGDQGAKDILEALYPPLKPEGNHDVRPHIEEEEPAPITSRMPRLIRRALTVLQSTRGDFRRFVRG